MSAKSEVKEQRLKPEEIEKIQNTPQNELINLIAKNRAEESALLQGFDILKRKEEELKLKQQQMEANIATRLEEVLQEKSRLQDVNNALDLENKKIEAEKAAIAKVKKDTEEALGTAQGEANQAREKREQAEAMRQEYSEKIKSLSGDVKIADEKKKAIEKELADLDVKKAQIELKEKQQSEKDEMHAKAHEDLKIKSKVLKHVAELFELAKSK